MLKAVTRSARLVDEKLAVINATREARGQGKASVAYYFDHYATDEDTDVSVMQDDFMQAKAELVPSVSVEELQHYEQVRSTFEGAAKKVESNGNGGARAQNGTHAKSSGNAPVPRAKLTELMRRAQSSKDRVTTLNGNGRSQQGSLPQMAGGASDTDEDYVIRTDRLSLNGSSGRPPSSKGKGKGKSRDLPVPDGPVEAAEADEDLYD